MTAEDVIRIKDLLPTTLGTEEIRETYAREILQRSFFSARTASAPYLSAAKEACARIASGEIDQATARKLLGDILERMGHLPNDGGGLANPAAIRRLDLIIDTQRQMAASAAHVASQTAATVAAYPAWRLTRFVGRSLPRRDWPNRWAAAGRAVGWEGALPATGEFPDWDFVALKSSPIWQALGDGTGGYKDTLGNPFPPFAFSSGLSFVGVDRDECIALGLVEPGEKVKAPTRPSLAPSEDDIRRSEDDYGISFEVEITA